MNTHFMKARKYVLSMLVAVTCGAALNSSALPILVGEWDGNSADGREIYGAQLAINSYNAAHNPDLPNLAVLPLPADSNDTIAALDSFIAKTTTIAPFFKGGDEKTIQWTAPSDFDFYYVMTKWGAGGAAFDHALHYVLAGETLDYNPNGDAKPNGLSHVAIWGGNASTPVPDGGTTILMMGAVFAGIGAMSRRFKI